MGVCVCVCFVWCVRVCVCVSVRLCVGMRVCEHECERACVCVHYRECVHMYMYSMYVCVYACGVLSSATQHSQALLKLPGLVDLVCTVANVAVKLAFSLHNN